MDLAAQRRSPLPFPKTSSAYAGLIGIALLLASLAVIAGWIVRERAIVQFFSGYLMVFNTVLCFALAGLAFAFNAAPAPLRRRAQSALGAAIAALGALVLAEYLSGASFGIDWPELHAWLPDSNPFPGRMAAAASAAFLLVGAAFVLMHHVPTHRRSLTVRLLNAIVAAVGLIGIAGNALELRDLFENYWLAQMSLPAAIGFVIVALAFWLTWQSESWNSPLWIKNEDERIVFTVGLVLTAAIVVAGVSGFRVLQAGMETSFSKNLSFALESRKGLVATVIERDIKQTTDMARIANVVQLYSLLARNPADAAIRASLQAVANNAITFGFSAAALFDAQGRQIASAGRFVAVSPLQLELAHVQRAALMWDGQLLLQTEAVVSDGAVKLGTLRAQHRLVELRDLMFEASDLGQTSEIELCGSRGHSMHCAPTRFNPRPYDSERIVRGEPLPMSYALGGQHGVIKSTDHRGKRVLAAYSLMTRISLGLVLKTDLEELYAPMRTQLVYLLQVTALLLGAGIWLLLWYIRPAATRLATSERRLQLALEASNLALWDWDISSGKVHLSEAWQTILGGERGPVETTFEDLSGLVHPDDAAKLREKIRAMLKGDIPRYDVDHRVRTLSGEWAWIHSSGEVIGRDHAGRALQAIGTNTDISSRKRAELQTAYGATHDELTDLPNRALFIDRLAQAISRSRRNNALIAVIYLDIDRFKKVNDTLGHGTGDALLREFARRLAGCARASDTTARLGGDEFTVILERLGSAEDGVRIAGNIVAAMRPEFKLDGRAVQTSTSLGIAFYSGAGPTSPDELMKKADEALYEAKGAGRDRFHVAA